MKVKTYLKRIIRTHKKDYYVSIGDGMTWWGMFLSDIKNMNITDDEIPHLNKDILKVNKYQANNTPSIAIYLRSD